jgi:glyoxylase-like metal-dependent hydrolase (beta-lactamase superfamily II)
MLLTDAGRVIVNTGLGTEAPHHRALFDPICTGPTPYIITTQSHPDQIGGVAAFRGPATVYIAQQNYRIQTRDDRLTGGVAARLVPRWFPSSTFMPDFSRERPDVPTAQDTPTPDLTFDHRLAFTVGGLKFELIAAVGETVDSAIVHLPQHRICLISNLLGPLFPHFPNLNTLRGQRYRFVEPYLDTIRKLRELKPELLITGRGQPIRGADLIDRSLERLSRAVDFVHTETLRGMAEGKDAWTLMREIQLPADLRVGQGYGKVAWGVRTIWESYVGWFHHLSTTELYGVRHSAVYADLAALAGVEAVIDRARAKLVVGEPVAAIHLAEVALAGAPANGSALDVVIDAHERLLATGGDVSFWENGWLTSELARLRALPRHDVPAP